MGLNTLKMTQEEYKGLVEQDNKTVNKYFRLYNEYIKWKCYSYTKNVEDSEDMAQEVFIKLLYSVKNFKGVGKEEKVFRTWLNTIINSVCCTKLQKQKKSIKTYSIDVEDKIYREPSANDIHIRVEDIIYNLNDNINKNSFIEYYINGKSLKDISLETDKKVDTIKVQCMRFRNNLMKEIHARVY